MDIKQFEKIAALTFRPSTVKSREACRLVVLSGMTLTGAAEIVGIKPPSVCIAVKRFREVERLIGADSQAKESPEGLRAEGQ